MTAPDRRSAPTSRELRNDVLVAVGFLVGALLSSVLYRIAGAFDDPAPSWAALPYALGIAVPLIWRKRYPSAMAAVVAATAITAGSFAVPEVLVGNIALFLAFYSVGAWEPNRLRAHLVRGAIILAMSIWLVAWVYLSAVDSMGDEKMSGAPFSPFVAFTLIQVLTNVLYFAGAYYYGERAWASALERRYASRASCTTRSPTTSR